MRRSGFTLQELIVTLTMVGILMSLAAPKLSGMVARERTRSVLNRFAADFFLARGVALRSGSRVEIRFTHSGACTTGAGMTADGWTVVVKAEQRTLRTVTRADLDGVCLRGTNDTILAIDARGMLAPFENRTLRALGPTHEDSLVINVLGRVRRQF